jgi:hypothetical protein
VPFPDELAQAGYRAPGSGFDDDSNEVDYALRQSYARCRYGQEHQEFGTALMLFERKRRRIAG